MKGPEQKCSGLFCMNWKKIRTNVFRFLQFVKGKIVAKKRFRCYNEKVNKIQNGMSIKINEGHLFLQKKGTLYER